MSTVPSGAPGLDVATLVACLRRNARVLSDLVADVGDDQARWKPSPAEWSILEVVAHLADEEVEDFRTRLDATLRSPGDAWSPIDPDEWAVSRRYNDGSLERSLERFLLARADSIAWLEARQDADWSAAHDHPRLGTIRAGDLLTSWVAHDHIHIRQLNRLLREFLVSRAPEFSASYAGRW